MFNRGIIKTRDFIRADYVCEMRADYVCEFLTLSIGLC